MLQSLGYDVQFENDTLKFIIPGYRPRLWKFGVVFLLFYLVVCVLGAATAVETLVSQRYFQLEPVMTLGWCVGCALLAAPSLLWLVEGQEVIEVTHDRLLSMRRLGFFYWKRPFVSGKINRFWLEGQDSWDARKREHLRFQGPITFVYDGKVKRIGTGLTVGQARQLLAFVREKFPDFVEQWPAPPPVWRINPDQET